MKSLKSGKLSFGLLALLISSSLNAETVLEFSGINEKQEAVKGTLVLKDSYRLGTYATPQDVLSYRLYDTKGEKDSSDNWQLDAIRAKVSKQQTLVPDDSGTLLSMENQFSSSIFYMNQSGKWEAMAGGAENSGLSGQWTVRQVESRSGNAEEDCTQGDKFHKAAAQNNVQYVEACLKAGLAVDTQEGNGWTALHSAAHHGRIDMIKLLLRYEANLTVADKNGRTALDQATLAKQQRAIDILKKHTKTDSMAHSVSSDDKAIDINDPKVLEAARFAAADLAQWRPESMTSPYLHSVVSAKVEKVDGTNYILRLKTNDTDVYTWDVIVFENQQGDKKLTHSKYIQ